MKRFEANRVINGTLVMWVDGDYIISYWIGSKVKLDKQEVNQAGTLEKDIRLSEQMGREP